MHETVEIVNFKIYKVTFNASFVFILKTFFVFELNVVFFGSEIDNF
jgi:hypothetical protein